MTSAPPVGWVDRADAGLADAWANRRQRRIWQRDPVAWANFRGIELWSKQLEILRAVGKHDRIAVRSCHSSGKTFTMSVLAAYWLDVHPPGTARLVSTAPTGDQVKGLLWNEINQLWERFPDLPGRVNQTELWIGNYQAGIGRKSSDYKPASFAGFHARHMLVIVDEADGIPAALWGAIDTLATNAGAKIVGIGNPDDPTSEFRRRQSDQGFHGAYFTIRIAAWDTPNFSGEEVSELIHDVLLSKGWVEEKRVAWGGAPDVDPDDPRWAPDHPFWSSKIEAEYPDEAANAVIRVADLLRARRMERDENSLAARRDARYGVVMGVDLAGSERGDESVARARQGNRLLGETRVRTSDPEELEDWLVESVDTFAAATAQIDADGIGHAYPTALRRRRPRVSAVPIRSAVQATDPKAYFNKRAEMWCHLGDLLRKTGDDQLDFSVLDEETAAQLLTVRRAPPVKGRILIESKDEIRKRIGRSPDGADAVVYCFYEAPKPKIRVLGA